MTTSAVERPIEREYRSMVADNRRWQHFEHRPGDILVCTPPKCGTTWMQTIVAALLFPDGAPGRVMELCPWLDARFDPIEVLVARLDAQTHRRSIKTHTPADGIPWWPTASYIVVGRDGRDALMSFLNHHRNMRPDVVERLVTTAAEDGIDLSAAPRPPVDDVHDYFTWFLDTATWFEHVASFWAHRREPNVLFVHYNDLLVDLDGQMRRVAAFLGVEVSERQWPEQVERCTFESMKRRNDEIADFDKRMVGGADAFLYKGTNGRWREVMTAEELDRFAERASTALPPEALAWTTAGESALG
jgi:aryl sulfotransferase